MILALPQRAWQRALTQDGADREGAWVSEFPLGLSRGRPGHARSAAASGHPPRPTLLSIDGERLDVIVRGTAKFLKLVDARPSSLSVIEGSGDDWWSTCAVPRGKFAVRLRAPVRARRS